MTAENTGHDALRCFLSGESADNTDPDLSLGGFKTSTEVNPLVFMVRGHPGGGIRGLTIDSVAGLCEPGNAVLKVAGPNELVFNAPCGATGKKETIAVGETRLVHARDRSKWARVTRSGPPAVLRAGQSASLSLRESVSNVISGGVLTSPMYWRFRCIVLYNVGDRPISNIRAWAQPVATATLAEPIVPRDQTETVTLWFTAPIWDWHNVYEGSPGRFWALNDVRDEAVYYTDVVWKGNKPYGVKVPYQGRDVWKGWQSSGAAWERGDTVYCIMPIKLGVALHGGDEEYWYPTDDDETAAPTDATFYRVIDRADSNALLATTLGAGEHIGLRIGRYFQGSIPAPMGAYAPVRIRITYDF